MNNKTTKEKESIVPIVFSINERMVSNCIVSINSIISKDKMVPYFFIILHNIVDEESLKALRKINFPNVSIETIFFDLSINRIAKEKSNHLGILRAADILSAYPKLVYMETSILAVDRITSLLDIEIGDNVFGAVPKIMCKLEAQYYENSVEFTNKPYFDLSLCIINTIEYRKQKIYQKCIEVINQKEDLNSEVKDALNIVAGSKIFPIENLWNLPLFPEVYTNRMRFLNPNFQERYNSYKFRSKILNYDMLSIEEITGTQYGIYFWQCIVQNSFSYEYFLNRLRERIKGDNNVDEIITSLIKKDNLLSEKISMIDSNKAVKNLSENNSDNNENYQKLYEKYYMEVQEIKKSITYRSGRIITYLPRLIRTVCKR